MADLPLLGDELRRRLALERDRQLGIDPGAGNDRGYAFNQWLPVSTNKVGSASWVQQGADPKPAVPEVMQGGLLGGADLLDSPRTGKLTPEALGSLLTGSTLSGGLLAPKGSLASGGSIKAYHGSPHDFDRFKFESTAGTGEGGAAYGHGLYFAENEGVAKSYKSLGSRGVTPTPEMLAKATIEEAGGSAAALQRLERELAGGDVNDPQVRMISQARDLVAKGTDLSNVKLPGHMYEVNINADPEKFLDWDKPLTQQTPEVQKTLADAWLAHPEAHAHMSGANIYESSKVVPGAYRDPAAASATLKEAGIPGIKYLDAVSRDRGAGTSNYVVFPTQEEIIQILRKYGLAAPSPVVPGAQGAPPTPGLLSDQQSEIPIKDRVY